MLVLDSTQHVFRQVESGGGSGHGAIVLRVDGLIPAGVFLLGLTLEVGRYGHGAPTCEFFGEG